MWQEKCVGTPSSCGCIRVLNKLQDAYDNNCYKTPRSNCSNRCVFLDTIQIHKRSCWEQCRENRSCCNCRCPKIKIKNMHSETSMEKCGDSPTNSTQFNKQYSEEARVEKEREAREKKDEVSKEKNENSRKDDALNNKENEVNKKKDDVSKKGSAASNNKVAVSEEKTCDPETTDCTNSSSTSSKISDTAETDDDNFMHCDAMVAEIELPESISSTKSTSKKTKSSKSKSTNKDSLPDTSSYAMDAPYFSDQYCCIFTCPECCQNITYCPYQLEGNRCFKCPECCRNIEYFDGASCVDTNCTCTNVETKQRSCGRFSFKNKEKLRKQQIYREFLEFCRINCYHPQIMECLLLSSRNMCCQEVDDFNNLYNSSGASDRVPFSRHVPPMTNYCMYGSRLDDWFTHYLMRYLGRVDSEDKYRALAWLNDVYNVIEEKHSCKVKNCKVKKLSRLYNSIVEPTISEMCFYNYQN